METAEVLRLVASKKFSKITEEQKKEYGVNKNADMIYIDDEYIIVINGEFVEINDLVKNTFQFFAFNNISLFDYG